MDELGPLSEEQFARTERRLLDPPIGGKIEAAKRFGIDLTLLVEQLRLSPAQRVRKLESSTQALEQIRGAARRRL